MPKSPHPRATWWRLLLIIPILAVLSVPAFNRSSPALWGFPFFYWYQMLWVVLCSLAATIVFLLEGQGGPAGDED